MYSVSVRASGKKVDLVRSLGADHVIDYTRESFIDGERYDVIIDTGGHSSLSQHRSALTRKGTLVIVGSETDARGTGGFGRSVRAAFSLVSQKLIAFVNSENHKDPIVLNGMIQAGKLMPVVDRTFPPSETGQAIRYQEEGRAQ